MTPQQKLERVFELNELGKEHVRTGIRQRYPNFSEAEISHKIVQESLNSSKRKLRISRMAFA
jgi:hypothetical protein